MVLLLVSVLDQFAWVGRELPYKKDGGALHILWELKKVDLAPLRVLSLKRSTAEAFMVPFVVLSRIKSVSVNVLFWNWYLLEVEKRWLCNVI